MKIELTDKFESFMQDNFPSIIKAADAIYEVTGITLSQMRGKSRLSTHVYARAIFWHLCHNEVQSNIYLSSYLNRDHATGSFYSCNYISNHEYDAIFQRMLKDITNVFKSK